MSDHTPSAEQQKAIDAALAGANVRCRAVPGAGKTFTCLRIAEALEKKGLKVLQLTYSSALKTEWRSKRPDGTGMFRPHSFHSFALMLKQLYLKDKSVKIRNEDDLREFLKLRPRLLEADHIADVIIIDETQDMCSLYYDLILWYHNACGKKKFQMVVVGQEEQIVYENGKGGTPVEDEKANLKYLTTDAAFACLLHSESWTECPFTKSFRLTPSNAHAINILFGTNIKGCNKECEDLKPKVICADLFKTICIAQYIENLIKTYGPENVQLVAPSWRINPTGNAKPVTQIKNELSKRGYFFDEGTTSNRKNKTLYYTCPGVKGTEAMCTVVIGADSFSDYYVNLPQKFVSFTRAREQLVIFTSHENVPWLVEQPNDYILKGFDVEIWNSFNPKNIQSGPRTVCVTDILRSVSAMKLLMDAHAKIDLYEEAGNTLPIPNSLDFGTHKEDLAKPFGIIMPYIYATTQGVSPNFENIFQNVIVSTNNNGKDAVRDICNLLEKNGHTFPEKDQFLTKLHNIRTTSQTEIAQALKNHLQEHNLDEYADKIITKDAYEKAFPLKKRTELKALMKKGVENWSYSDSAQAAIATDAFGHDHQLISQILHYDWTKTDQMLDTIGKCLQRYNNFHFLTPIFEYPVSYNCKPRRYDNIPYEICGIEGRIDALLSDETYDIVEYKFKEVLENSDFVQVFIYLCILAVKKETKKKAKMSGLLFNVKTNEKYVVQLEPKTEANKLLEAVLDIHHYNPTTNISVESIIENTIMKNTKKSTKKSTKRKRLH